MATLDVTDNTQVIRIHLDGGSCDLVVDLLPDGYFRVAESPWFFEEFGYDDVIEVTELHDANSYKFLRVVTLSRLERSTHLLTREQQKDRRLESVKQQIEDAGGYWESAFGGGLFVALPVGHAIDIADALK